AWTYYSDPYKYKLGVQYPAPIPDTDGYVHVSVDDFSEVCVPYGAIPMVTPTPWSRWDSLVARIGPQTDDIHLNAIASGVWDHASSGTPGTTILASVLPVSLASFFNDYTTARLTGNFTYPLLAGQLPTPYAELPVGSTSSDLEGGNVALNHLAVRYIVLSHGSDTQSPCFAASLKINVGIPEGVTSFPFYYANTKGSPAQALTVSGSTASITVPWNTCGG